MDMVTRIQDVDKDRIKRSWYVIVMVFIVLLFYVFIVKECVNQDTKVPRTTMNQNGRDFFEACRLLADKVPTAALKLNFF